MIIEPKLHQRLKFLINVIRKECQYLKTTDERVFSQSFTLELASTLSTNSDLAEKIDAFVSRFSRLQDTIGDKLLPLLLTALGEKPSSVIDNLDRAERLGLIISADEWMTIRNLRNQMIHEYIDDLAVLTSALQTGHTFVAVLIATADKVICEIKKRGWG